MCAEYKDITDQARTAYHVGHNQVSAQSDSDIDKTIWYRFVSQTTGNPMQV